MAAGLGQYAFAGVNQDHRQPGGRGSRCHVAGVLLVARRVGHDEAAAIRGEKAVGHVNGDALFAFGLQAIHQQREINPFALGAVTLRFGFQRP